MWVGEGQGSPSSKVGFHFAGGHVKRSCKVLNLETIKTFLYMEKGRVIKLRSGIVVATDSFLGSDLI